MATKANYKKTTNYLFYRLSYPIPAANDMIKRYGIEKDIEFPSPGILDFKKLNEQALYTSGDHIQSHWNEFMSFYGSVKKEYRREPTAAFPEKKEGNIEISKEKNYNHI